MRCCCGLSPSQIREHKDSGIYVEGMSEHFVTSPSAVYDTIRRGSENRATASTNMNRDSSRSHSVFVLTLIQKNLETLTCTTGMSSRMCVVARSVCADTCACMRKRARLLLVRPLACLYASV
jgi:hypothetical protein